MSRLSVLVASIAFVPLDDTYALVENDQPLPSDPSAPFGCCLTPSGSLTFTAATYDLRTSHCNNGDEGPGSDRIRANFER